MDIAGDRRAELLEFAEGQQERFRSNEPFPHLVLDDFFPAVVLDDVLAELSEVEHEESRNFFAAKNRYLTYDLDRLAPTTQRFLIDLNSAGFCSFLETLTGIGGLISDASLFGGGFQEMGRGGYLKMHADFSWHERLRLDRRLNLLIYLNKDWQREWGGELVLGDPGLERFTGIAPLFNRSVVFSVTDSAFHGVPDPIECPEGEKRKALALYYYTAGRPAGEVRRRSTQSDYRRRPGETFDGAGRLRELPARLVERARSAIDRRKRRPGSR
jgi:Rps23 Pro-64 3,4-dihydroxylase Tpa1-like proline 4-hydroxylase